MSSNHKGSQGVVMLMLLSSLACSLLGPTPATPDAKPTTTATPRTFPPIRQLPTSSPTPFPMIVLPPTVEFEPNPAQPASAPHFRQGQEVDVAEVHMVSRTEGWGLSGPYVFTTDDGGDHWREVTPPHPGLAASSTKAFGAFEGSDTAWIVFSDSGDLNPDLVTWRTLDGGLSWTPSRPVYQEVYGDTTWAELRADDAGHVWMAVRGVYVGAGSHYVAQLFRTTNAGVSWEPIASETDLNWTFTGIEFAGDRTGWLTWETLDPYDDGAPNYAVTGDGGLTWDTRELPAPPESPTIFEDYVHGEPYAPTFLNPTSMRVLVASYDFLPPPPGAPLPPGHHGSYLYASDDAGKTWRVVDLPEEVFAANYDLVFFDADTALLLGREIFQTLDGGRSWDHVKTVFWDGQFSFVDPLHGWAVATSGEERALVRTVDGGSSWEQVEAEVVR